MEIPFVKGHGTENDFVLVPDATGALDLPASLVVQMCDRHAGIGADGLIRVVRTASCDDPAAVAARADAEWFMDYRNADGSLAEMCGNGIRVMARHLFDLHAADLDRPLPIATRDGIKTTEALPDGRIIVEMGPTRLLGETKVAVAGQAWRATRVSVGNPHAVAFVDDLADAGPLLAPPDVDPEHFPQGANVEFVVRRGPRHIAMRVHERGVGETRSCGTGVCAAAAAAVSDHAAAPVQVDVPGGTLTVSWNDQGAVLSGPAVLVATGIWLAS